MCNKVDTRIECEACGYPYSEALWPDDHDDPLPCDVSHLVLREHIRDVQSLGKSLADHPYDCKCLLCR